MTRGHLRQEGGVPTPPRVRSQADPAGCTLSGVRSHTQALNRRQGNRRGVPGGGPGDSPLGLCLLCLWDVGPSASAEGTEQGSDLVGPGHRVLLICHLF